MMGVMHNERAKRAAEFSPGWSERSEAEPWVTMPTKLRARFSGRQNSTRQMFYRPPKRAGNLISQRNPGLRFACPGLNSAAGYAGLLIHLLFNSAFQTFFESSSGN